MKSRLLKILAAPFPDPRKLIYRSSSGWGLIRQTLRRPPAAAPETFANACERFQINDDRLQTEIIPALRRWRRTVTIMGWFNLGLFVIGISLGHANMIVMAFLASILCFVYAFRWQFHGWQCKRRELAGLNEFLADRQAFFQIFLW